MLTKEILVEKIIWPIQVLNLLVINHEQATVGLRRGRVMSALGNVLQALNSVPDTPNVISIFILVVKTYSVLMNRSEARSQFKKDVVKQLEALLGLLK